MLLDHHALVCVGQFETTYLTTFVLLLLLLLSPGIFKKSILNSQNFVIPTEEDLARMVEALEGQEDIHFGVSENMQSLDMPACE